jgi:hypothetical protein
MYMALHAFKTCQVLARDGTTNDLCLVIYKGSGVVGATSVPNGSTLSLSLSLSLSHTHTHTHKHTHTQTQTHTCMYIYTESEQESVREN